MRPLPIAVSALASTPRRTAAWLLLLLVVLLPVLALVRGSVAMDGPGTSLGDQAGTGVGEVAFGLITAFGDGGGLVALVGLAVSVLVAARRTADAAFVLAVVVSATVFTPFTKNLYQLARPPAFSHAATAAIVIPSAWVAVGAALGAIVGLLTPRRRRAAITGGAVLLLLAAEALMYRAAPVRSGYDSFPSGHAIGSMALATAVVLVSRHRRRHRLVAAGAIGYALAVGISRMYLGFHYPVDVAAGWSVAVASAVGVWLVWPRIVAVVDRGGRAAVRATGVGARPERDRGA